MDKSIFKLFFLSGVMFLIMMTGNGQLLKNKGVPSTGPSKYPVEKVVLFTDRSIYCTAEKICFKAMLLSTPVDSLSYSTILYVELTTGNGTPVVRLKYPLDDSGSDGMIDIPRDIPSGVYYLKAYTKWMRNFQPAGYAYKAIKVINPFSSAFLADTITPGSAQSGKYFSPEYKPFINCATDRVSYHPREKVTLTLLCENPDQTGKNLVISVIRKGSGDFIQFYQPAPGEIRERDGEPLFLPETRGLSVSGRVTGNMQGNDGSAGFVQLSCIQNATFYASFLADEKGRFVFNLPPAEGISGLVIQAMKDNEPVPVETDSEFCANSFVPGTFPFNLTESEKIAATDICINQQISENFPPSEKVTGPAGQIADKTKVIPFYGKPSRIINTGKYIRLPSLFELIYELIPEFWVENGKKNPVIRRVKPSVHAAFSPLCLVDGIPVNDLKKFFGLPTDRIEKVEIIDHEYVTGNIIHDGLINVISKNRDLAGIKLPENSKIINFHFFSDLRKYGVDYQSFSSGSPRIPDRRNTLYWNPKIRTETDQGLQLYFYTADTKGEFEVLIQGVSADGQIPFQVTKSFQVE